MASTMPSDWHEAPRLHARGQTARVIPGTTLTYGEHLQDANTGATSPRVGRIVGLTCWEVKFLPWEMQTLGNADTGVGRRARGKCVRTQTPLEANLSDPVLPSQERTTQKSGKDSRGIFWFGRREKNRHSIVWSRKQDGCFYTPSGPATNPPASAYKDSFPLKTCCKGVYHATHGRRRQSNWLSSPTTKSLPPSSERRSLPCKDAKQCLNQIPGCAPNVSNYLMVPRL